MALLICCFFSMSGLTAQGQFDIGQAILESDFVSPKIVGSMDVDEDGYNDLLVTSGFDGRLGWYPYSELGFGRPHYIGFIEWNYFYPHENIALADLNGDGRLDIVALVISDLVWMENLGDAQFSELKIIDESAGWDKLKTCVLNGLTDIYLELFNSETIMRYENIGLGVFEKHELIELSVSEDFVLVNLDGEGLPELVAYGYDYVEVHHLDSELPVTLFDFEDQHVIQKPLVLQSDHSEIEELIFSFRRNSDADVSTFGYLYFRNDDDQQVELAQKIFCNALDPPVAFDFNGDGSQDLLVEKKNSDNEEGFQVILNTNQGAFGHPELDLSEGSESSLTYTDAFAWRPNESLPHIILNPEYDEIQKFALQDFSSYHLESSFGEFYPDPELKFIYDIDGNGLEDLVLKTSVGMYAMKQTEPVVFQKEPLTNSIYGASIRNTTETDTDVHELFIGGGSKICLAQVCPGCPEPPCEVLFESDSNMPNLRVIDLDNDGDLDAVHYGSSEEWWFDDASIQGEMYFLENFDNDYMEEVEMTNGLPLPPSGYFGPEFQYLISDLNDDHLPEIIVYGKGNEIHIYRNLGDLQFEASQILSGFSAHNQTTILATDLNSDGWVDLLNHSYHSDDTGSPPEPASINVAFNDGSGLLSDFVELHSDNRSNFFQAVHDVNNDGLQDIVLLIDLESSCRWLKQTKDREFVLQDKLMGSTTELYLPKFADINGNGAKEIISRNRVLRYFENQSLSRWDEIKLDDNDSDNDYWVAKINEVHDFDGDEDPDVLGAYRDVKIFPNGATLPKSEFMFEKCGALSLLNYSQAYFPHCEITWDFGDGNTSNKIQPDEHVYDELGTYEVSLTICNEHGCNTKSELVEINQRLENDIELPQVTMLNTPVGFKVDHDGFTNFSWFFGDGTISIEESPQYSYTAPGEYEVEVIITDSTTVGCTKTLWKSITVVANELLNIFPNPSSSRVNVFIPSIPEQGSLRVVSLDGRIVYETSQLNMENEIDFSSLGKGIYFVEMISDESTVDRKKLLIL